MPITKPGGLESNKETNNPKELKSNNPNNPEQREKMLEGKRLTGNFGGRKPMFATPEELEERINEYLESFYGEDNIIKLFNKSQEEIGWDYKRVPSVTGLTIALGFVNRQSLFDYIKKGKEFSDTIKSAKGFIENFIEERLIIGKGNATGLIFNLKNNYNWVDKHEVDNKNSNINIDVSDRLSTSQMAKIANRFKDKTDKTKEETS